MSKLAKTVFVYLIAGLLTLGIMGASFGSEYYSASYDWSFQNFSYMGFGQAMNFTWVPHLGAPYDNSLICNWNFDEGSGAIVHDSSGNGNNGSLYGGTWVDGKYGDAVNLNGALNNYVVSSNSFSSSTTGTISVWINPNGIPADWTKILGWYGGPSLFVQGGSKHPYLQMHIGGLTTAVVASSPISPGVWQLITATWNYDSSINQTTLSIYINGALSYSKIAGGAPLNVTNPISIGANSGVSFSGSVDDFRLYNRALSSNEILALYEQSNPLSCANYYYFTDPMTNNTMIMNVNGLDATVNNSVLVTCTNFFAGNTLSFQANNSASINVWTNLGQSAFTTGLWNSENYTTTLTLDTSSTGELNWNTYNITTYADAHSSVSPSNVTIPYGGTRQFNMIAKSGYYISYVYVDGIDQGNITTYSFTNIQDNHTISVTSAPLANTSSPTSTPSPPPSPSVSPSASADPTASSSPSRTFQPTVSPKQQAISSQFPTETVTLAAVIMALIIASFALVFKKGYISIEVVDEENPQETQDDYTI
jgi:hypothetical protein